MLQIKEITKQYKTGDLVQKALDGVSLSLRDNEFVSILGPSGSGKTTLLNIIGGLDHYDSGDMFIDGVSTKKYNSRAWDSYRNHSIGFVFQSYNLIPHQSILANVELALTIGGIKGSQRKKRAEEALREVGLEAHMHKRPNQLSGGQMQRVAIARALVNNPSILLADEPTGALDTETGIQVMEILKKVAEKRLVVMVTHNPELAQEYSTRIVRLKDGRIVDDSAPFEPAVKPESETKKPEKTKKANMSFLTSLALSFNNLRTKKARTILTSVAGSIGIIGIALILALSSGVNDYIYQLQRDTMEKYPITINAVSYTYESVYPDYDDTPVVEQNDGDFENKIVPSIEETNSYYSEIRETEVKNNLSALKTWLEKPENDLKECIGQGYVVMTYDTQFLAYTKDTNGKYLNTSNYLNTDGTFSGSDYYTMAEGFTELPQGQETTISEKVKDQYELIYGDWPENEDECVIIADQGNMISARTLCQFGLISTDDYVKLVNDNSLASSGKVGAPSFEEICKKEFILLPESTRYEKNDSGLYDRITDESPKIMNLLEKDGVKIKIKGIIRKLPDDGTGQLLSMLTNSWSDPVVAYNYKLTDRMIKISESQEICKKQLDDPDKSVVTGIPFDSTDTKFYAKCVRKYLKTLPEETKTDYYHAFLSGNTSAEIGKGPEDKTSTDPVKVFDDWVDSSDDRTIKEFFIASFAPVTDLNSALFMVGYSSHDRPSSIIIYPDTFEGKNKIFTLLETYNSSVSLNDQIQYVDYIKDITDQISSIITTISAVLIAFVAVSLLVSCIMIGIITHISVLERTKEIGILRALGASKGNISQVFNAETFIIGLLSGIIGIVVAALLCIPANAIIAQSGIIQNGTLTAAVPPLSALILIAISTLITVFGGLIPANSASRKDPVIALRSE